MKKSPLFLLLIIGPLAFSGHAQAVKKVVEATSTASTPSTPLLLVSPTSGPVAMTPHLVQATVPVKWNESSLGVTVNYRHEGRTPLKVQGVKTTAGFFIVDYPRTIPPGGTGAIELIASAKPNTNGEQELVTLLSEQGEKTVRVIFEREAAVSFAATKLSWTIGEAVSAKTVAFVVMPSTAIPTKVRALGSGNTAVLEPVDKTNYRVRITPGSTAKAQQFPVIVEFEPALPGVSTVIYCSVAANE
ncbi:MAG TPA: hypothetical protein VHO24_11985 [Opitutaceae bacterium]|nr:hypothetical protein [Opitutaceae bacterium]